ncbi:FG-GAP-like repeat-containing protein, partial [Thermodesulfobacteriota bacterium]
MRTNSRLLVAFIAIFTLALLINIPDHAMAQRIFCDARFEYQAGSSTYYGSIGDFNEDEAQDIVVTNTGDDTISILFGLGGMEFQDPVSISTGDSPYVIAVGDFNEDSHQDLATVLGSDDQVSIHLGIGDGNFVEPESTYPVGDGPDFLSLGDFNGDGHQDIVTTNYYSDDISILLGNGDGTFQTAINTPTGIFPLGLTVGDFDEDGNEDLALVAFEWPYHLNILISNGDGTFQRQPTTHGPFDLYYSMAVGDFNEDTHQDLAIINTMDSDAFVILLGNGDGTFPVTYTYEAGNDPDSLSVGDFDGDGIQDLAIVNGNDDLVSIFIGLGDGTFEDASIYGVSDTPKMIIVGDLDGDIDQDLAVVRRDGVSILRGRGDGTFDSAPSYGTGQYPGSIAVGDFDGNGSHDLATANRESDNVSVLLNLGDGTFGTASSYVTGVQPSQVAVGDFDGNGFQDLITLDNYQYETNDLSVLLGNGDGTFQDATRYSAAKLPRTLALGDFNLDGNQDIALAGQGTGSYEFIKIILGNGDGTFTDLYSFEVDSACYSIAVGDFDNDDVQDLVTGNYSDISVLLGTGDGHFSSPSICDLDGYYMRVAAGDFDEDGAQDVAVTIQSWPMAVLLGNGDGTFGGPDYYDIGFSLYAPVAVEDVNMDGDLDLALPLQSRNRIFLLLGNGEGTFQNDIAYGVGNSPYTIVGGDFDGDGARDLATANSQGDDVSILINCIPCWDVDGDGYEEESCGGDDCDDLDPDIYPGAVEICSDDKDNDCDGFVDILDEDCQTFVGTIGEQEIFQGDEELGSEPAVLQIAEAEGTLALGRDIDGGHRDWRLEVVTCDREDISGGILTLQLEVDGDFHFIGSCPIEILSDGLWTTITAKSGKDIRELEKYVTDTGTLYFSVSGGVVVGATSLSQGDWIVIDAGGQVVDQGNIAQEDPPLPSSCTDVDLDGYAIEGGGCGEADCDDDNPDVNPGAVESYLEEPTCSDTLDNDCDGLIDDLDYHDCLPCEILDCDDENPCTDDDCVDDLCQHTNNTDPCDDESVCTVDDVCSEGDCIGTPITCDDGEFCTYDSCDPLTSCVYTQLDGGCSGGIEYCSDDVDCPPGEFCLDLGVCDGGAADGNPCPTEATGQCDATGAICRNDADCSPPSTSCVFMGYCEGTGSQCYAGAELKYCTDFSRMCVSDNDCTLPATCEPLRSCVVAPGVCAGMCFSDEMCAPYGGGTCTGDYFCCERTCSVADVYCGGSFCEPCLCESDEECDNGNECTDDTCNPVTEECEHTNNTASCEDGDACTTGDTCADGACVGGPPLDCDDENECTDDACNPVTEECDHTNNTISCDDGDACTDGDTCADGTCVGGPPLDCDDGNVCTDDTCDPATGCMYADNTAPCDDGDACTDGDTCSAGACVGGPPPDCDDGNECTDDACNPDTGECEYTNNTAPCDDGNACTDGDICAEGACAGGPPLDCDNGLFCDGEETCDEALGCQAGTAPDCEDAVSCTDDACNEETDSCDNTPNDGLCDDSLWCNGAETCDEVNDCQAGPAPDCVDLVACTDDTCNEATDSCDNTPNDGFCDNGLFCDGAETCNETVGCEAGTAPDCDDGVGCTVDACNEDTDTCDHVMDDWLCDDGFWCNGAETCDEVNDCQAGVPQDCDDGVGCTVDVCNEDTDTCDHTGDDGFCDDGLWCNGSETCDEMNDCQSVECIGNFEDDFSDGELEPLWDVSIEDPCATVTEEGGELHLTSLLHCDSGAAADMDTSYRVVCGDFDIRVDFDLAVFQYDSSDTYSNIVAPIYLRRLPPNDNEIVACIERYDRSSLTGYIPSRHNYKAWTTTSSDFSPEVGWQPTTDMFGRFRIVRVSTTVWIYYWNWNSSNWTQLKTGSITDENLWIQLNTHSPWDNEPVSLDVRFDDLVIQSVVLPDCDDGVGCTVDACNEDTDSCDHTGDDGLCDDGAFCNGAETCDEVNDCQAGVPPDCDDGNECTNDTCDPATGCMYTDNTEPCDDGNLCTTEDTCSAGGCVGGAPPDCDDGNECTDDACDPATGCGYTDNTEPCDDGNLCTTEDTCSAGGCVGGAPPDCDDGNVCTDDTCDPATGCGYTDNTEPCDDGNLCTTEDT